MSEQRRRLSSTQSPSSAGPRTPGSAGSWFSPFATRPRPWDDGLFIDEGFPVENIPRFNVRWKRPKEICQSPQFIVDEATRMDVCQGELNDCWFLSAVASLSLHQPLLERVVPHGQSFQEGYTGCFVFQFWQYGKWQQVKIDDFLPTVDGQLIYLKSSVKEEFWSSLLEKAYAKLKGGYKALNMGFPHEAMVDMTGGVTELFNFMALPRDVGHFLRTLLKKGALINCANVQGPLEQRNKFGILFRHAYSVTGLEKFRTNSGGEVELVRVRNPWGKAEWEGPWSDMNGPEWNQISAEQQRQVGRVQQEDGEFWMALTDFCLNFDQMEVCHLTEATLSGMDAVKPWECTLHHGSWVYNITAGGPPGGARYWQNPQFKLTLLEEDDDPSDPEQTCTFLVALMQKYQRLSGIQLAISVHIYKARPDQGYLTYLDLGLLQPLLSLNTYSQCREVVIRGRLPPGNYIIIPSTSEANQEGEFILRILTEKGNISTFSQKPQTDDNAPMQEIFPVKSVLPSTAATEQLFQKHCKNGQCQPVHLFNLLKEIIGGGALAESEKELSLEHCKSFVVLMDNKGFGHLDWTQFQSLWEKFRKWTNVFVQFDKNKSCTLDYTEILPALTAAGLQVDDFLLQLIGQRYTDPDMTVSYPGFLHLLLKLNSMIQKFYIHDIMGTGTVSLNYRQWLYLTMYN
ncbi:calpain-9-like [Arapaima gigas]